jgi:sugar phosphate isomerase/epimerase
LRDARSRGRLGQHATEVAVFVACSTLCFGTLPLADALRRIGELGFTKVDVAVGDGSPHLKPDDVTADIGRTAQQLRAGPGLAVAAFHIELAERLSAEEATDHVRAMCRLARVLAAPLVSLCASPAGSSKEAEIERLARYNRLARGEGVTLAVATKTGTLTDDPAVAVELCQKVPGLGIALDPSHYLVGPYHDDHLDILFPYVQHVRLRDTDGKTGQFQVRIGQGEIEYGRIVNQLARYDYRRTLSVDIHDQPEPSYPMPPEVRKLKYLLESLI